MSQDSADAPSWAQRRLMMWVVIGFTMAGCAVSLYMDTDTGRAFITIGLPSIATMVGAYVGFAAHQDNTKMKSKPKA